MRKSYILFSITFLILSFSGNVFAYPMNTGELVGYYTGNENAYDMEELLGFTEGDLYYGKTEGYGTTDEGSINLTVTYDGSEYDPTLSRNVDFGSWSADMLLLGYTVKGANGFALYSLDPLASSGFWNNSDIMNPGDGPALSHFIGYAGAAPVPEPSTIVLMGLGLVGLASVGRKKFKI